MLQEWENVYQSEGEPKRRWFFDDYFDLIVWYNEGGGIFGFQLCYDKERYQRAITWKSPVTYFHMKIDDGENRPGRYKATPILVPDGIFDYKKVAQQFKQESSQIEKAIAEFVFEKLLSYK